MTREALRCAWPALALAALVLAPFLNKAFTIDDTLFLRQAQQVLADPLHPTAFSMVWSEAPVVQRMSAIMPSGPAMAYLLAPAVAAGGSEWIAHLVQLALFGIAIVATAALALRLGGTPESARFAALLLAATPAALAMAGTAMPDVPAMAFGVLGLERLLAFRDERRIGAAVLATLALALAPLARSHLLLLVGVGALFLRRETFSRAGLPLALAPLVMLGVLLVTRDPQGAPFDWSDATQRYSSLSHVGANAAAYATHWTLALPYALPYAVLRWRSLARQPLFWGAAVVAAAIALRAPDGPRSLWLVPVIALGVGAVGDTVYDAARRRDSIRLALGLWLLVPLAIAPYIHLPAKYLLAAAPAAAILVARDAAARPPRFARALIGATAVAGVALGVAILRADAALAGLGRRAAAEWIAPRVAAGENVWFAGHWGFQWYAERAGARPLTVAGPHPRAGDVAVSSARSYGEAIDLILRRSRLAVLEDERPGGRIMSFRAGAGFYSNYFGLLPWGWADEPSDRLELWRVESSG